jgi:hypothetical protein
MTDAGYSFVSELEIKKMRAERFAAAAVLSSKKT